MKRSLFERLKKLEKNTFDGNTLWCVRVEAGDRWTPYEITIDKGVERQRLYTMTGEAFLEWQNRLGRRALVILDDVEVEDEE